MKTLLLSLAVIAVYFLVLRLYGYFRAKYLARKSCKDMDIFTLNDRLFNEYLAYCTDPGSEKFTLSYLKKLLKAIAALRKKIREEYIVFANQIDAKRHEDICGMISVWNSAVENISEEINRRQNIKKSKA